MKKLFALFLAASAGWAANWTLMGQAGSNKKARLAYLDEDSARFYESHCGGSLFVGDDSTSCHFVTVWIKITQSSGAYRTMQMHLNRERGCSYISNDKNYSKTGKFQGDGPLSIPECLPDTPDSMGYILHDKLFGPSAPILLEDLKCREDAIRIAPEYKLGSQSINTQETHYNHIDHHCYLRVEGVKIVTVGDRTLTLSRANFIDVSENRELASCRKAEANGEWICNENGNPDIKWDRFVELTNEYLELP